MAGRPSYEWDENKRRTNLAKHGVDFAAMHAFDWESNHIRIISLRKANPREEQRHARQP